MTETYTMTEMSKATGIPRNTIHVWMNRGFLPKPLNMKQGVTAKFSETMLICTAIMGACMKSGYRPSILGDAIRHFMYFGDVKRNPGGLFKSGETWLIRTFDPDHVQIIDMANENWYSLGLSRNGAILVHIDPLLKEIRKRLK